MTYEQFAQMKITLFTEIANTINSKAYSFLDSEDHASKQAGYAIEAVGDAFTEMAEETAAGLAAQHKASLPK